MNACNAGRIEDRLATFETRDAYGRGASRLAHGARGAFPFNAAGVALYRRLGFTAVGVYREQGQLDGKSDGATSPRAGGPP